MGMFTMFVKLTFVLGLATVAASQTIKCYSCSYTFTAPDGLPGYECVDKTPTAFSKAVYNCTAPNKCLIKTVYERDYSRLSSLTKYCGIPEKTTSCDVPSVIKPTCYLDCDKSLCNGVNGDLAPTTSTDPNTGVTTACRIAVHCIGLLFAVVVL